MITNLGFPNTYNLLIKKSVEGYWQGKNTLDDILKAEQEVRKYNILVQTKLDLIPVFDFDVYDRLLRTSVTFGIVPTRFGKAQEVNDDLDKYLNIPRGKNTNASPMVKWFNTNYHVIQPEIENVPKLVNSPRIPLPRNKEKLALIGPHTFLSYAINRTKLSRETLFEKLSEEYVNFINSFKGIIQLEEPSFTDYIPVNYNDFLKKLNNKVHLHTYFGPVDESIFNLDAEGIGLDLIEGDVNLSNFPKDKTLIAGIINGRNIRPFGNFSLIEKLRKIPEDKLYLSPSCSLAHVPIKYAINKIEELCLLRQ